MATRKTTKRKSATKSSSAAGKRRSSGQENGETNPATTESANEELKAAHKEVISMNEELKAAHKEVISMNEELQSAFEELETSKEKLQSMNEELTTVNNQLQEKVEQLEAANDDITNLLASSEIATLFLDRELRIKMFSRPTEQLLSLIATDVGRPISDFAQNFNDPTMLKDCRKVLRELTPLSKEVCGNTGRYYLRRIFPYRTADNLIPGVVVTIIDFTEEKNAELKISELNQELKRLVAEKTDELNIIHQAVATAATPMCINALDGKVNYVNRAFVEAWGYDNAEEVLGRDQAGFYAADETAIVVAAALDEQGQWQGVRLAQRKDGSQFEVRVNASTVTSADGSRRGVGASLLDVSHSKNIEHALQRETEARLENEALLKAILESLIARIAVLDASGKIIAVNPAWQQFAEDHGDNGLIGQGVGANYLEAVERASSQYSDVTDVLSHSIKSILSGSRKIFHIEFPHRASDKRRWFLLTATSMLEETGGAVISCFDMTEHKEAELALFESEGKIRAILNSSMDGIVTISQHGIIESINPAAENMFGYEPGELDGQKINVLMPSPYREEHDQYLADYLTTGVKKVIGFRRELIGRRKDGSTFPIELAVSQHGDSKVDLFTGSIHDISERRELQKQLLAISEDEKNRIGQDLHDSTQQELTGLGLMAQSLVETLAVKGAAELETATSLAKGIAEANRHVRMLARGIVPVNIDAQGLMSALQELARSTRELNHIECECLTVDTIEFDDNFKATHLYRIAQEAINNSLKHSGADHIQICLEFSEGQLVLEVRDNGIGVDDEHKVGHGIGLRIMQYRANLIGATLTVKRRDEGGTEVVCCIRQ